MPTFPAPDTTAARVAMPGHDLSAQDPTKTGGGDAFPNVKENARLGNLTTAELRHLETGLIHNFGCTLRVGKGVPVIITVRHEESGRVAFLATYHKVMDAWETASALENGTPAPDTVNAHTGQPTTQVLNFKFPHAHLQEGKTILTGEQMTADGKVQLRGQWRVTDIHNLTQPTPRGTRQKVTIVQLTSL